MDYHKIKFEKEVWSGIDAELNIRPDFMTEG